MPDAAQSEITFGAIEDGVQGACSPGLMAFKLCFIF